VSYGQVGPAPGPRGVPDRVLRDALPTS